MRWNASYVNYAECDDVEGGSYIHTALSPRFPAALLMYWCTMHTARAMFQLRTGMEWYFTAGQCIFGDGIGVGVGRINPFYWPGKGNACGFPDGTSITGQCWTNLTGGVWLSFQKPGECKNGSPIGRNGIASVSCGIIL